MTQEIYMAKFTAINPEHEHVPTAQLCGERHVTAKTLWFWGKKDPAFPLPRVLPNGRKYWLRSELLAYDAILERAARKPVLPEKAKAGLHASAAKKTITKAPRTAAKRGAA
jgi:hypothetical protein